jgi:hypothetical protein
VRHLRDGFARIGALVAERRWFDVAHGSGDHHLVAVPVFVVGYAIPDCWPRDDAPFTFRTSGLSG